MSFDYKNSSTSHVIGENHLASPDTKTTPSAIKLGHKDGHLYTPSSSQSYHVELPSLEEISLSPKDSSPLDKAKHVFQTIKNVSTSILKKVAQKVQDSSENVFTFLNKYLGKNAQEAFKTDTKQDLKNLKTNLKDTGRALKGRIQDIKENAPTVIKNLANKVGDALTSLPQKIKGSFETLKEKKFSFGDKTDQDAHIEQKALEIFNEAYATPEKTNLEENIPMDKEPSQDTQKAPSASFKSMQEYSLLLDELKNGTTKLSKNKSKKGEIKVKETSGLGLIVIDKKSKTAFKEMQLAAREELKNKDSNPLEVLDLLNKMQSSAWGKIVLKHSPKLKGRFEKTVHEAIERCVKESRQQFTACLSQVTEQELLDNRKYAGKKDYALHCPHLALHAELSNNISYSVANKILSKIDLKERIMTLDMYIKIAHLAYKEGDYSTANAIFIGLNQSSVDRLKKTFEALSPKTQEMLNDLKNQWGTPSPTAQSNERKSYKTYKDDHPKNTLIPTLAPFLSPLLFAVEKQESSQESLNTLQQSNHYIQKFLDGQPLDDDINKLTNDPSKKLELKEAVKVQELINENPAAARENLEKLKDSNNRTIENTQQAIQGFKKELETLVKDFQDVSTQLSSTQVGEINEKNAWYKFKYEGQNQVKLDADLATEISLVLEPRKVST